MIIANEVAIERYCGRRAWDNGNTMDENAARVNAAVDVVTGGRLPCYAIPGKRGGFKWVSVGSSAVIGRSVAAKWLARFGADIEKVEAA